MPARLPPELYARELLLKLSMDNVPVEPLEICQKLNIEVCYEPLKHCEALLCIKKGSKKIILNKNITYHLRHKFSLAHEIAHYYIPYHDLQVFACFTSDIMAFKTNNTQEQEANKFASELLMPIQYIQKEAKLHDYNAETVKMVADKYSVSITAAAIRLLEFTPDKAAIVLLQDGKVKWFMKSQNFRYRLNIDSLNEATYVYDFFNGAIIDESLHQTYAHAWINGEYDREFINEQSIIMLNLNMALTILTLPFNEDDEYDDEWNY